MKPSLETVFRDNLKFYRRRAKLSQEKLSSLLDKNINYINMIEGGKSIPPLSVIEQIAEILQVEPHCFLDPREGVQPFDRLQFVEAASTQIAQQSREILLNLLG